MRIVARLPQQHGDAVGGVLVVVDHQHAQACADTSMVVLRRGAGVIPFRHVRRRTTNSLPCPSPALKASTLPPCMFDDALHDRQPNAEPALAIDPATGPPA